jgi:hypothetical protein
MPYAETVLLAIQAGVRLYGASRKAYADSVRGRALFLPLPRAPGLKADGAEAWFLTSDSGQAIAGSTPRIKWLLEQLPRSQAQDAELVDLYRFYRSLDEPAHDDSEDIRGGLWNEEMAALLEVRQWSDSEASSMASPLQTITGSLVNIAADYFLQSPGLVSEERPGGRALKAFFEVLNQTDFSVVPPKEIATGLLVAVLDVVSAHPDVISGCGNEQKLITNVSKSLLVSAKGFLKDATDKERREAGAWLELIGHAVLKGAVDTVLSEPGRYFKVKPGTEAELVVQVGTTITNLLLGDRQLNFRRLLSAAGLNKVVNSALAAVAKNPEILKSDNKGLENIIVALAEELWKTENKISPDIFPEIVRIVLDKTADNFEVLWGKSSRSPQNHLLIMATGTLLKVIAEDAPQDSKWRPQFTPDALLEVAEVVLNEVADNPAWLIDQMGNESGCLHAALDAVLAALRKVPRNRISAQTGIVVLKAGIGAVALRRSLLDKLPAEVGQPAKAAMTAVLDAIFDGIFADGIGTEATWNLARNSTLQAMVEIALSKVAKAGGTRENVKKLRQSVQELLSTDKPFNADAFATQLDQLLLAA